MCEELAQYLPNLWSASEDHDMLRCSILSTLVSIVQGLGTITESIAPFLQDVIMLSTNINNPCRFVYILSSCLFTYFFPCQITYPFVCLFTFSVYLLEDGLELWLVALQNSRQLLPQWLQLSANIPPILELGSENLRTMIYIVQAYVILAPTEFITACGGTMVRPLNGQYSDLQDEGVLIILRLVDLVLKVGPPQTSVIFKDLIIRSLKVSSMKYWVSNMDWDHFKELIL